MFPDKVGASVFSTPAETAKRGAGGRSNDGRTPNIRAFNRLFVARPRISARA
jgi:hypothetical protein